MRTEQYDNVIAHPKMKKSAVLRETNSDDVNVLVLHLPALFDCKKC